MRLEGELSHPVTTAESNRKKKVFPYFLARSQPMKSHGLLIYCSSLNFFILPIKSFSFPCHAGTWMWLTMFSDLKCNSLLISNKPTFAEEISGSLFVSGQHFDGLYGHQSKLPVALGLVNKQGQYPQFSPLMLIDFLPDPEVWRYIFLLDPSSCPLYVWNSPGSQGTYFKVFKG